jgi:hypothetical protein
MTASNRRFPPPWMELEACLVVIDGAGQKLAYGTAAKLLTEDEARRIAANVAAGALAETVVRACTRSRGRSARLSRQMRR